MGREGLVLKGKGVVEGCVLGEALVSTMPVSFLGGVDPETGVVVEKGHDLEGECLADKILCFPHGKGSTVGSYVLLALKKKGLAPLALVNEVADPIVVVGAVIADIPMVVGVDLELLRTGDILEVDGSEGLVRVMKACS
ncbi:hypothetical protein B6U66_01135 [Candidatus Bathyarchaeota archaeon ex4484_135]|nr:MAG: hypothetical protein B6U66_01135 [Candidatus Bathyarchaeota archaeon ex4484_135]